MRGNKTNHVYRIPITSVLSCTGHLNNDVRFIAILYDCTYSFRRAVKYTMYFHGFQGLPILFGKRTYSIGWNDGVAVLLAMMQRKNLGAMAKVLKKKVLHTRTVLPFIGK